MIAITYSADPTWAPRHVLAIQTRDGLAVRDSELGESQLGRPAFVFDAHEKLRELRGLGRSARLSEWVRWQGLCVGIEEVPDADPSTIFAAPLSPKKSRAA